MAKEYLPRIADELLKQRLSVSGAVLVEGPKWCGKTRTAKEISKSQLYMQDPDKRVSYLDISYAITRGGWPISIGEEAKIALRHSVDYIEAIINTDISRVDNISRNPVRARVFLKSLARNISTLASIPTIRNDIATRDGEKLSDKIVGEYLNALDRIFVTENLPAWNPALRSKRQNHYA